MAVKQSETTFMSKLSANLLSAKFLGFFFFSLANGPLRVKCQMMEKLLFIRNLLSCLFSSAVVLN